MHQSPLKQFAGRRDKYGVVDSGDAEAERRMFRASQPKARRHSRDEDGRDQRSKSQHPRG
jgi:hypothetical protein